MWSPMRSRQEHRISRRLPSNTGWTTAKKRKSSGRRARKKPPRPFQKRRWRKCWGHTPSKSKWRSIAAGQFPCNLTFPIRRTSEQRAVCLLGRNNGSLAGCLIAQRLAGFQSVGDALLRLALAAKRHKGFALEVEDVLFGDGLRRGDRAAR